MKKIHCGFIGLGLIGGSIAKALKEKRTDIKISAYDINSETLSLAYKEGIADYITNKIDATFSDCDILFLCAPVSCNDDNLLLLKQYLPQSCILTDVGSVKGEIHKQIDALGLNHIFIGGHPMAGSERYGYNNSNATLLENAYYILTPTTDVREDALAFYKELIISIDAIPLVMSHTKHDYITAAVCATYIAWISAILPSPSIWHVTFSAPKPAPVSTGASAPSTSNSPPLTNP